MRAKPPQMRPVSAPCRLMREQPADQGGDREAGQRDQREAAVDDAHPAVLDEVLARTSRRGPRRGCATAIRRARATGPFSAPWHTGTVTHVRGVRVALLVGVRVVLAVVGDPVDDGSLHRQRTEDREQVPRALVGLECAVREHAVEARRSRRSHSAGTSARRRRRRTSRARSPHSRGTAIADDDERQQDGGHVHTALESGHAMEATRNIRFDLWAWARIAGPDLESRDNGVGPRSGASRRRPRESRAIAARRRRRTSTARVRAASARPARSSAARCESSAYTAQTRRAGRTPLLIAQFPRPAGVRVTPRTDARTASRARSGSASA